MLEAYRDYLKALQDFIQAPSGAPAIELPAKTEPPVVFAPPELGSAHGLVMLVLVVLLILLLVVCGMLLRVQTGLESQLKLLEGIVREQALIKKALKI